MNHSKESKPQLTKNKIIAIIQIVLGGTFSVTIAFLLFCYCIVETPSILGFIIVFLIIFGFIAMVLCGLNRLKQNNIAKQYIIVLNNITHSYSITELSNILRINEAKVIKDLEMMIKKEFLKNAYVDKRANQIIFPYEADLRQQESFVTNRQTTEQQTPNTAASVPQQPNPAATQTPASVFTPTQPSASARKVTAYCINCGTANEVTIGSNDVCAFCGKTFNS